MKTISGIEFASEHNGTDVFRLIELAYEQGQKDAVKQFPSAHGTYLAEVGTDSISRQQAIDAFNTNVDELVVAGKENADSVEKYLNRVIDKIKELPSAQPTFDARDTQYNLPIGTDCISRQAAINAIDECYCGGEDSCGEPWIYQENAVEAIQMIEPILPAEPQIIRCKDCKHWIPYDWMFSEVWQSKNMANYPEDEIGCDCCDMAMKANDFCSRAERRTE